MNSFNPKQIIEECIQNTTKDEVIKEIQRHFYGIGGSNEEIERIFSICKKIKYAECDWLLNKMEIGSEHKGIIKQFACSTINTLDNNIISQVIQLNHERGMEDIDTIIELCILNKRFKEKLVELNNAYALVDTYVSYPILYFRNEYNKIGGRLKKCLMANIPEYPSRKEIKHGVAIYKPGYEKPFLKMVTSIEDVRDAYTELSERQFPNNKHIKTVRRKYYYNAETGERLKFMPIPWNYNWDFYHEVPRSDIKFIDVFDRPLEQ